MDMICECCFKLFDSSDLCVINFELFDSSNLCVINTDGCPIFVCPECGGEQDEEWEEEEE